MEPFGSVELGDTRRTARAVEMAAAMARRPGDGLTKQRGEWPGQTGAYRLLDKEAVSHEGLSRVHGQATRQQAGQHGPGVLMVQDITELDDSPPAAREG